MRIRICIAALTILFCTIQGTGGAATPANRHVHRPAQTAASILRLQPGNSLAIFAPGTPVLFTAALSSPSESQNLTLAWEARDLKGTVIAQGTSRLTGSSVSIRFTPPEPGIVYLQATARDAAGALVARAESRAAIFIPRTTPVPSAPFLFAVSAHTPGYSAPEAVREIELMRMTGFAACRFDFGWEGTQPGPDTYNWETYDRLFTEFARNHVIPLPMIGYGARWATTGDPNAADWHQWANAPPRTDAYTAFARKAVERYGKYTHYWEIWNEPDIAFWLGTAEQYAELLSASVRAIHEADPQAKVMNGGYSETKRRPDFIPRVLERTYPRTDIYAYHSRGPLPNLIRATEDTRGYLKNARWNDIPLWINESGFSNTGTSTEWQQASELVKKMAYAPSIGCSGYVWYDLRNDGEDANENEHNFGLVRRDFSPKAALVAAHTTMETLAGKRFLRRLDLGEGQYALLFAGNSEQILVYWDEAGADSQQSRLLRTGAKAARTISMMGVTHSVPIKNGILTTLLTREPQFLVLKGDSAANLTPTPKVLDAPSSIVAAPSSRSTIDVTIANPLPGRLSGDLLFSAQSGWRVSPARVPIALASGQTKRIRITVTSPEKPVLSSLRLQLRSAGLPQLVESAATLLPAKVVPALQTGTADADLSASLAPIVTLSGRDKTVSLFEATPMRELHMTGPQDLSAQVFLAHDANGILLGVRVRDDKHVQNEVVNELWKSDSIQVSLITPRGQHYEWTAGLTDAGPRLNREIAPPGTSRGEQPADTLTIRRTGDITYYQFRIPATLPGIREMLAQGGGLNLLVNDNDGQGRKGWVEWSPGIGRTKDPTLFPRFVFSQKAMR